MKRGLSMDVIKERMNQMLQMMENSPKKQILIGKLQDIDVDAEFSQCTTQTSQLKYFIS